MKKKTKRNLYCQIKKFSPPNKYYVIMFLWAKFAATMMMMMMKTKCEKNQNKTECEQRRAILFFVCFFIQIACVYIYTCVICLLRRIQWTHSLKEQKARNNRYTNLKSLFKVFFFPLFVRPTLFLSNTYTLLLSHSTLAGGLFVFVCFCLFLSAVCPILRYFLAKSVANACAESF